MTYGVTETLTGPVDMYDRLHAELLRRTDGKIDGLLVHIGRVTPAGFQVIEVWESKEWYERSTREVVWPLAAELFGDQPPMAPATEEFDVRGLVLPGSRFIE